MTRVVRQFGTHLCIFTQPNEVELKLIGLVSLEDAEALLREVQSLGKEHGPLLVLVDVSRYERSGSRVRQLFMDANGEPYPVRAGLVWGAPFPTRIAMTMVIKAASHIRRDILPPIEFVGTAEQAQEWLEAQRAPSTRKPASLRPTGT